MTAAQKPALVTFSPDVRAAFRIAGETIARIGTGVSFDYVSLEVESEAPEERTDTRALVLLSGIVAELVSVGTLEPALSDGIAMRAYSAVPWVRIKPLAGLVVAARQTVNDAWILVEALAEALLRSRRLLASEVFLVLTAARRGGT